MISNVDIICDVIEAQRGVAAADGYRQVARVSGAARQ
jgi:hypothetical protein